MSRCDSLAIVANTSEDLPEPLTPVNTRQAALRDLEADVLEVVLAAPATRDEGVRIGDARRRSCALVDGGPPRRPLILDSASGGVQEEKTTDRGDFMFAVTTNDVPGYRITQVLGR